MWYQVFGKLDLKERALCVGKFNEKLEIFNFSYPRNESNGAFNLLFIEKR